MEGLHWRLFWYRYARHRLIASTVKPVLFNAAASKWGVPLDLSGVIEGVLIDYSLPRSGLLGLVLINARYNSATWRVGIF